MIKDFDALKKAMREHESDMKRETKTAIAKMITPSSTTGQTQTADKDSDLRVIIQQMAADKQTLKEDRNQPYQKRGNWRGREPDRYFTQNRGGGTYNHGRDNNRKPYNHDGSNNRTPDKETTPAPQATHPPTQRYNNSDTNRDITCWRCGQTGHLQIGCRVRLDHSRRAGLNFH